MINNKITINDKIHYSKFICLAVTSNKQYIRNVNKINKQVKKGLLILKIKIPIFLFKYCLNIDVTY